MGQEFRRRRHRRGLFGGGRLRQKRLHHRVLPRRDVRDEDGPVGEPGMDQEFRRRRQERGLFGGGRLGQQRLRHRELQRHGRFRPGPGQHRQPHVEQRLIGRVHDEDGPVGEPGVGQEFRRPRPRRGLFGGGRLVRQRLAGQRLRHREVPAHGQLHPGYGNHQPHLIPGLVGRVRGEDGLVGEPGVGQEFRQLQT